MRASDLPALPSAVRTEIRPPRTRASLLPNGWPIYALFLGFPVWWVLGLGGFIWIILAIPMAAWLFRQRKVLVPRRFGIWITFLVWMLGSATQLDAAGLDRHIQFAYRASLYISATIILLYVLNMSREALPTDRVIAVMVVFWIFVVAGGVLGVLMPQAGFTSPVEMIMPRRLLANDYVRDLVHPASAQVMDILGYEAPRPKAPFVYATNWGAAFGVLMPFVILGWKRSRTRVWRVVTAATFVVAIVPVVASLDRGLWLSLGVGLTYAAVRLALAGKGRALRTILIVISTVGVVIYLTPLRTIVADRFANPHSNERRLSLYEEATERVMESPLIGFGSPLPSSWNPNAPPVGTQGQFWLVLVSQGIVGAALFVWWFVYAFWRMRKVSLEVPFWCHTLILIALVQMPFYDWLPAPLSVIMIAIALSSREMILAHPSPSPSRPGPRPAGAALAR